MFQSHSDKAVEEKALKIDHKIEILASISSRNSTQNDCKMDSIMMQWWTKLTAAWCRNKKKNR